MSNELVRDTSLHSDLNEFISQILSIIRNVLKLLEKYKQTNSIERESIEDLDKEVALALAEAQTYHIKEIVIANITELARAAEYIDQLEADGKLKGTTIDLAYGQLEKLNEELRNNLRVYYNRDIDEERATEHRLSALQINIPKDSTDLIHLSDALCKVMKNMPVEVDSLPTSLRPTVSAFMLMDTKEKSDFITQINEAVVATNYRDNRNILHLSLNHEKNDIGMYTNSFLADRLNFERTIMLNKEMAEKTINEINMISQQDTVSATTTSIDLPQQHTEGVKTIPETRVKQSESLEEALMRFKRSVQKADIHQKVSMRTHNVSPSLKRKPKSEAARKNKRRS